MINFNRPDNNATNTRKAVVAANLNAIQGLGAFSSHNDRQETCHMTDSLKGAISIRNFSVVQLELLVSAYVQEQKFIMQLVTFFKPTAIHWEHVKVGNTLTDVHLLTCLSVRRCCVGSCTNVKHRARTQTIKKGVAQMLSEMQCTKPAG